MSTPHQIAWETRRRKYGERGHDGEGYSVAVTSASAVCECGDHAWIPLNRGFATIVSPEDAAILDEGGWYASVNYRGYVTVRKNMPRANGRRLGEILHRRIIETPNGKHVDHANRDTTDNRRANLRCCTSAQNAWNRAAEKGKAIPLKGVRKAGKSRFQSMITVNKKKHHLGTFATAEEAHAAYVAAAVRLHGEFARAA